MDGIQSKKRSKLRRSKVTNKINLKTSLKLCKRQNLRYLQNKKTILSHLMITNLFQKRKSLNLLILLTLISTQKINHLMMIHFLLEDLSQSKSRYWTLLIQHLLKSKYLIHSNFQALPSLLSNSEAD